MSNQTELARALERIAELERRVAMLEANAWRTLPPMLPAPSPVPQWPEIPQPGTPVYPEWVPPTPVWCGPHTPDWGTGT